MYMWYYFLLSQNDSSEFLTNGGYLICHTKKNYLNR